MSLSPVVSSSSSSGHTKILASLLCTSLLAFGCSGTSAASPDGGLFDAGTRDGATVLDSEVPPFDGPIAPGDISILFPLPQSAAELTNETLSASSSGARGVLFPSALYERVSHITGSSGEIPVGGTGNALWSDLHVVAVRVDPCFASLAPDPHGKECEPNMRLVLQEVRSGSTGEASAFDSALHVFYRITRQEVFAFAHAVGALRQAYPAPESPHPLILRASSALGDGVRSLVLQYAGAENLTRVTALSGTDPGFTWDFRGFDVAEDGSVTPMNIPTLPEHTQQQQLHSGFSTDAPGAQFLPSTTSADNFESLANAKTAATLTEQQRAAAFAGVVHIHNPSRHSPDTIDCTSCHFSAAASAYAEAEFGLIEREHPDAFHADSAVPTLEPEVESGGGFNVHAFSYFSTSPGINQRTVNETAALTAYMNAASE